MRPELIVVSFVRTPVRGHLAHEGRRRVWIVFEPFLDVGVGSSVVAPGGRAGDIGTVVGPQPVEGELVGGTQV